MLLLKLEGVLPENPEVLMRVKSVIESKPQACVVIVSAVNYIDQSIELMFDQAMKKGEGFQTEFKRLKLRYEKMVRMLPDERQLICLENMLLYFDRIYTVLSCSTVLKSTVPQAKDYILSLGEQLMLLFLGQVLEGAENKDAKEFIVTDEYFGEASVLRQETGSAALEQLKENRGIMILSGGYGKSKQGYVTRLGQEGREQVAAIMAAALNVEETLLEAVA